MEEKDLRVERRDENVMNKMDNRNHGKDCAKLEKGPEGQDEGLR